MDGFLYVREVGSPRAEEGGPRGRSASLPPMLKRPVEEVRKELLEDPRIADIAKQLNIEVAAYVEKILDYAQHPDKQPVLNLLPDDVVKAQGGHTMADVKQWFEKVDRGEIDLVPAHLKDGFDDGKGRRR